MRVCHQEETAEGPRSLQPDVHTAVTGCIQQCAGGEAFTLNTSTKDPKSVTKAKESISKRMSTKKGRATGAKKSAAKVSLTCTCLKCSTQHYSAQWLHLLSSRCCTEQAIRRHVCSHHTHSYTLTPLLRHAEQAECGLSKCEEAGQEGFRLSCCSSKVSDWQGRQDYRQGDWHQTICRRPCRCTLSTSRR